MSTRSSDAGRCRMVDRAGHVVGGADFDAEPGKTRRVAVRVTLAFRAAAPRGPVPAGVRMTSEDALDGTSTESGFVVAAPQAAKKKHGHRPHARRHPRRR